MKKIFPLLFCSLLAVTGVFAQERHNLSYNQLPQTAQIFLKTHLADLSARQITQIVDSFRVSYEVRLTNDNQVVFNRDGSWRVVSMPKTYVPQSIIPADISEFLTERFGKRNWNVTKIAKAKGGYNITANGQTLFCNAESMARMNKEMRDDAEYRAKHNGMSRDEIESEKNKKKTERYQKRGLNADGGRNREAANGKRKKSNGRP
ncbi:MAG: PepSY-like domain-containing protein [Bacteroidales bacterium]|nr:PepSY-like domain-containing protein [Bacteroidales bacterium]